MERVEEPQAGYCRRGVEELAAGKPLVDALDLVERLCAQSGAAFREALCQAVESATSTTPPAPARALRVLFLEVERMLARLWTLAECARAGDLTYYQGQALDQRETLFAALQAATGARCFWGVALPGGARDDIPVADLGSAVKALEATLDGWRRAADPRGPLGRVGAQVGVISAELAQQRALTGLAAAGSLAVDDLRRTAPYGGYADLGDAIDWPESSGHRHGDVSDRLRVAVSDLTVSYAIVLSCVSTLEGGASKFQTRLGGPAANASGKAQVEGPHGPLAVEVALGPSSEIRSLALESHAGAVLDALPLILEDTRLDKAPLILASLDLCLECNDR